MNTQHRKEIIHYLSKDKEEKCQAHDGYYLGYKGNKLDKIEMR